MRKIVLIALGIFILLSCAASLEAEAARVALVIGNAAYSGDALLKNPVNDATDVANSLKQIGWNVTLVTDADRRTFNRAIVSFRDALIANEGANALFYYAGHGIQADGANYLIPVKTDFESMEDIKADGINIQLVSQAVEQAKASVSLIILDACRNNPFEKKMTRSLGSETRGLSVVQSAGGAKGSAIMFSTSPGDVALDGKERNGVFTSALLKYINSDLKLEEMFKKVTGDVRDLTGGAQKPWINASLSSDFYFVSDAARATRAAEAAKLAEAARQAELAKAAEAARLSEASKTEQAKLEAEAAKKAAAEAMAAKAQAEAALALATSARNDELNRPKGKVRIESLVSGSIYIGDELLGEIGPDTPLMADSLATGRLSFKLVSSGSPDETKSITVTEKVYTTVVFGKRSETVVSAAANKGGAPGSLTLLGKLDGKITFIDGPADSPWWKYQDSIPIQAGQTRKIEAAAGQYTVEASFDLEGTPITIEKKITINPDADLQFPLQLESRVVRLSDENGLTDAVVFMGKDKEPVGTLPLTLVLPPTNVDLTIIKPWGEPIRETVDGSVPKYTVMTFANPEWVPQYDGYQQLISQRDALDKKRSQQGPAKQFLDASAITFLIAGLGGAVASGIGYLQMTQAETSYNAATTAADATKYRTSFTAAANTIQFGLLTGVISFPLSLLFGLLSPDLGAIDKQLYSINDGIYTLESQESQRRTR